MIVLFVLLWLIVCSIIAIVNSDIDIIVFRWDLRRAITHLVPILIISERIHLLDRPCPLFLLNQRLLHRTTVVACILFHEQLLSALIFDGGKYVGHSDGASFVPMIFVRLHGVCSRCSIVIDVRLVQHGSLA